jgi:hypothetical protein
MRRFGAPAGRSTRPTFLRPDLGRVHSIGRAEGKRPLAEGRTTARALGAAALPTLAQRWNGTSWAIQTCLGRQSGATQSGWSQPPSERGTGPALERDELGDPDHPQGPKH